MAASGWNAGQEEEEMRPNQLRKAVTMRATVATLAIAATLVLAVPAGAAGRAPARAGVLDVAQWLGELLGTRLGIDVGGLRSVSGEEGPYIDPDGLIRPPKTSGTGQLGPGLDPNGDHSDLGPELDPDG